MLEHVPPLILRILEKRGIRGAEALDRFLAPKLKDLKNPFEMKDMDLAVERLLEARSAGEKVCVYGDFDLDGTSGLALLYSGLQALGFRDLQYYQPRRLGDGYGLHAEAVEELAAQGVRVLVTVDVGITGYEAARRSQELGVDLIITDHHLPGETLPEASIIVNPNRSDCASDLGYLSGAGVAFYLVMALRSALRERGEDIADFNPKSLLDCFVIGTLTDMVPLRSENRVLAKHGLLQLSRTQRPGLRRLLEALGLQHGMLTSQDVVMQFAPKLNALSRMDAGLLPVEVFLQEDPRQIDEMVNEILQTNERRKALQREAEALALFQAESQADEKFLWVYSDSFHKGVIGLVATRLVQKYERPAFVGSWNRETGEISGSARSPEKGGVSLPGVLAQAQDLLLKHGGHARAAGFGLRGEQAESFRERLRGLFRELPPEPSDVPSELDEIFPCHFGELNEEFWNWYESLEPFGTGFPVPRIELRDALVSGIRELRGGHLRLDLGEFSQRLEAIFFSPPPGVAPRRGQRIHLRGRLGWNSFGGKRQPQMNVEEITALLD